MRYSYVGSFNLFAAHAHAIPFRVKFTVDIFPFEKKTRNRACKSVDAQDLDVLQDIFHRVIDKRRRSCS